MKKNITITWANEKGGVGKTTLCTLFANYLSEKKFSDVCILDCDRQHSIVDKRKFDSQSRQTDKVPYEVKQTNVQPFIEAGSGHHPHQLQAVQLRQYSQCGMSDFHRAQQGTDSADAERQGRYSLICSNFHRVTSLAHYMPSPREAR